MDGGSSIGPRPLDPPSAGVALVSRIARKAPGEASGCVSARHRFDRDTTPRPADAAADHADLISPSHVCPPNTNAEGGACVGVSGGHRYDGRVGSAATGAARGGRRGPRRSDRPTLPPPTTRTSLRPRMCVRRTQIRGWGPPYVCPLDTDTTGRVGSAATGAGQAAGGRVPSRICVALKQIRKRESRAPGDRVKICGPQGRSTSCRRSRPRSRTASRNERQHPRGRPGRTFEFARGRRPRGSVGCGGCGGGPAGTPPRAARRRWRSRSRAQRLRR